MYLIELGNIFIFRFSVAKMIKKDITRFNIYWFSMSIVKIAQYRFNNICNYIFVFFS